MNPADLLRAAQACPPELMREMSRAALREALTSIAAQARALAADPALAKLNGQQALTAFADTMDKRTRETWGGAA